MKYALLIYAGNGLQDFERLPEEEQRSIENEFLALLDAEPSVYGTARLQPPESSTTVRMQEGKILTTDGPFADTKEVLGGVWLLEADDLDVPLELAARIPVLRFGGVVEVRPLVER